MPESQGIGTAAHDASSGTLLARSQSRHAAGPEEGEREANFQLKQMYVGLKGFSLISAFAAIGLILDEESVRDLVS